MGEILIPASQVTGFNAAEIDPVFTAERNSLTTGYIPKKGTSTLIDSSLFESGSNLGIGTESPDGKLTVAGRITQSNLGGSTFIGTNSGASDDLTSNNNTLIGVNSLQYNTTGDYTVAIGYDAGKLTSLGANNLISGYGVFLGAGSKTLSSGGNNEIVIGANAIGHGSNTTTIGTISTTNAYIYGLLDATLGFSVGGTPLNTTHLSDGSSIAFTTLGSKQTFTDTNQFPRIDLGSSNVYLTYDGSNNLILGDSVVGEVTLSDLIGGSGSVYSIANIGDSGIGVYDGTVSTVAQLRKLNSVSNGVTITHNATTNTVDFELIPTAIETVWGNIGGNIINQTDLMDALGITHFILSDGTNIANINNEDTLTIQGDSLINVALNTSTKTLSLSFNGEATVSTINSITGLGTTASPLKLVNDQDTPGVQKYYGTSLAGTKGFFDFPAFSGAFTDLSDVIPDNYVGRANAVPIVTEDEANLDLIDTEEILTETAAFTLLADVPQTYAGYEGYYVRVRLDGLGLEFVAP